MKTTTVFATALGAVLVLSMASLAVAAFGNGNGANYDADVHEALVEAMEQGDFESWRTIRKENGLPMRGRVLTNIDAENFERFVQMRRAYHEGDVDRASELREELRGERLQQHSQQLRKRLQKRMGACGAWN
ncbi:MAG: hypothetical protein ACMXYM_00785 [Candidatus Woesearchaeota archaeon]